MKKLMGASLLLVILTMLSAKAFASSLNCEFQDPTVLENVKSIQLTEEFLFINGNTEIPLQKTEVRCGNFGKQVRYDGMGKGYQVILESCTSDAELKGVLVDHLTQEVAEIECR